MNGPVDLTILVNDNESGSVFTHSSLESFKMRSRNCRKNIRGSAFEAQVSSNLNMLIMMVHFVDSVICDLNTALLRQTNFSEQWNMIDEFQFSKYLFFCLYE